MKKLLLIIIGLAFCFKASPFLDRQYLASLLTWHFYRDANSHRSLVTNDHLAALLSLDPDINLLIQACPLDHVLIDSSQDLKHLERVLVEFRFSVVERLSAARYSCREFSPNLLICVLERELKELFKIIGHDSFSQAYKKANPNLLYSLSPCLSEKNLDECEFLSRKFYLLSALSNVVKKGSRCKDMVQYFDSMENIFFEISFCFAAFYKERIVIKTLDDRIKNLLTIIINLWDLDVVKKTLANIIAMPIKIVESVPDFKMPPLVRSATSFSRRSRAMLGRRPSDRPVVKRRFYDVDSEEDDLILVRQSASQEELSPGKDLSICSIALPQKRVYSGPSSQEASFGGIIAPLRSAVPIDVH